MHFDRDSGVTAVREPAHHLRRPPLGVVLLVVLVEGEVELAQRWEPRQAGQHLVPEEEVQKARAVDPIGVCGQGPHLDIER